MCSHPEATTNHAIVSKYTLLFTMDGEFKSKWHIEATWASLVKLYLHQESLQPRLTSLNFFRFLYICEQPVSNILGA